MSNNFRIIGIGYPQEDYTYVVSIHGGDDKDRVHLFDKLESAIIQRDGDAAMHPEAYIRISVVIPELTYVGNCRRENDPVVCSPARVNADITVSVRQCATCGEFYIVKHTVSENKSVFDHACTGG